MIVEARIALDSKDMKIISMLSNNPDVSQEEIARHVKLSQPAVGMRIKKLTARKVLSKQCGLNLKNAGLFLGKVDIFAKSMKDVLRNFEHCPFFLNGFVTSGKNNLCLLLIGEDLSSLQCIVDHHLKENPAVERIEDSVVISASKQILCLMEFRDEKTSKGPCGSCCEKCLHYTSGDCLGCPVTLNYRGRFWK